MFSIAIDILDLEAEGIKAVKNELVSIAAAKVHKNAFKNLGKNDNEDYDVLDNNSHKHHQ